MMGVVIVLLCVILLFMIEGVTSLYPRGLLGILPFIGAIHVKKRQMNNDHLSMTNYTLLSVLNLKSSISHSKSMQQTCPTSIIDSSVFFHLDMNINPENGSYTL